MITDFHYFFNMIKRLLLSNFYFTVIIRHAYNGPLAIENHLRKYLEKTNGEFLWKIMTAVYIMPFFN